MEETQTLKRALGSFWGSRPDQSAASVTPKLLPRGFSAVRIAGTGYSRVATGYSVITVDTPMLTLNLVVLGSTEE